MQGTARGCLPHGGRRRKPRFDHGLLPSYEAATDSQSVATAEFTGGTAATVHLDLRFTIYNYLFR